jgi:hypothetical protein
MKCFFISIGLAGLLFLGACGPKQETATDMVHIPATASEGVDRGDLPEMKFENEEFDFGTITQGEKVSHDFKFENTGETDLVISSASGDCGCTVAEVPKKPIPPGGSDIIRVTFDSDRKTGINNKQVTILTNCMPNKRMVKIKANVFKPQSKNPS